MDGGLELHGDDAKIVLGKSGVKSILILYKCLVELLLRLNVFRERNAYKFMVGIEYASCVLIFSGSPTLIP